MNLFNKNKLAITFLFGFYLIAMNNVSFKANLVVDSSLYNKMPQGTPDGYTDSLVRGYKKFLDNDIIKNVTEGDTIELYKDKYNRGFALGIRYTSNKLEQPIESGIYTNKKIPTVTVGSLIHDTMIYLIIKSGIQQKYSETTKKNFIRALQKLLDDNKNVI